MASTKRNISLAAAVDKAKIASGHTYIMLLEIDVYDFFTSTFIETLRIANSGPPDGNPDGSTYTFEGKSYTPARFDIQIDEKSGDLPTVSLTAQDVAGIIRDKMEAYNGGVGFGVRMHIVHTTALLGASDEPGEDFATSGSEITENFLITEASIQGTSISAKLGDKNQLGNAFPRRRQHRDFCQWKYKGDECKYAGATAGCDRTLQGANGCSAHSNSINFGGFPGLQARYVS